MEVDERFLISTHGLRRNMKKPPYAVRLKTAMDRLEMNANQLHKHVASLTNKTRGSTYPAIRDYVSGRITNPRHEILKAAAECLRVRENWLIHGTPPMTLTEEEFEEEQIQARRAAEAAKEPARAALAKKVDEVMAENREHGGTFANVAKLETWAQQGIRQNVANLPILMQMAITEFVSSVYTTVGPVAFNGQAEDQWSAEDARGDLRVSESDVTAYVSTLTQPLARLAETAPDWEKAAAVHSLLASLYICEVGGARS